jgi:hypothetical protein
MNTANTSIACGNDSWVKGVTAFGNRSPAKVAARGSWADEDTYAMKLCFYETPFVQTITCKFSGDQVTVNRKMNVGFGPTEHPALQGRLA